MKNKAMLVSLVTTVVMVVSLTIMTIVSEVRTNPEVTMFGGILFLLVGIEIVGGAVLAIIFGTKGSDNQLDERQLKARGEVAIYTLLSTVAISFAIALLSHLSESFLLTTRDSALIIGFTALYTFLISSDINGAYVSYKGKRTPLAVIYLVTGFICLIFSGSLPISLPKYFNNDFSISTFILSILVLTLGVEMIIKGVFEKKEALADEES